MSVQIVMNGTGDTRHEFDANDPAALAEAERRFRALSEKGYLAVAFNGARGVGELITTFNPQVERTMFMPRLVGG